MYVCMYVHIYTHVTWSFIHSFIHIHGLVLQWSMWTYDMSIYTYILHVFSTIYMLFIYEYVLYTHQLCVHVHIDHPGISHFCLWFHDLLPISWIYHVKLNISQYRFILAIKNPIKWETIWQYPYPSMLNHDGRHGFFITYEVGCIIL